MGELQKFTKLQDKLPSMGYDGVIIKDEKTGEVREMKVFNPNQIKTKSQLTDIWKQVHKEIPTRKPPVYVKAKKEAVGTTIRKITGVRKIKDVINLPESTLLNLKLKSEVKGAKEGLRAGKDIGKITGEIKGGKRGLRTGLRVGKKVGLEAGKEIGKTRLDRYKAKLVEKARIKRALKSVFKKYRHPEKSVDFATLKEIEGIQSKMDITKPSQLGETTIDELEGLAYKVAMLRKRGRQVFLESVK